MLLVLLLVLLALLLFLVLLLVLLALLLLFILLLVLLLVFLLVLLFLVLLLIFLGLLVLEDLAQVLAIDVVGDPERRQLARVADDGLHLLVREGPRQALRGQVLQLFNRRKRHLLSSIFLLQTTVVVGVGVACCVALLTV